MKLWIGTQVFFFLLVHKHVWKFRMSSEANYTFDHNASLFLYQIFPPNLFLNMNMGKKHDTKCFKKIISKVSTPKQFFPFSFSCQSFHDLQKRQLCWLGAYQISIILQRLFITLVTLNVLTTSCNIALPFCIHSIYELCLMIKSLMRWHTDFQTTI